MILEFRRLIAMVHANMGHPESNGGIVLEILSPCKHS